MLVFLNDALSSGWRLYVLGRALRAAWAATMAVMFGTIAVTIIGMLVPERRHILSAQSVIFELLRVVSALFTALATLGYFMPDWTRLSATVAALVMLVWILTGVAAMAMRG